MRGRLRVAPAANSCAAGVCTCSASQGRAASRPGVDASATSLRCAQSMPCQPARTSMWGQGVADVCTKRAACLPVQRNAGKLGQRLPALCLPACLWLCPQRRPALLQPSPAPRAYIALAAHKLACKPAIDPCIDSPTHVPLLLPGGLRLAPRMLWSPPTHLYRTCSTPAGTRRGRCTG